MPELAQFMRLERREATVSCVGKPFTWYDVNIFY